MGDYSPGSSHLSVNRAELKKLDTDTCNILAQFEKTREWADLTNCLIKLNRILTNSTIPHIPYKEIICKRLAQCLNHQLPTGVHIRALEVYGSILAKTTTESLSNDLALFSTGLFPFFSYSSHTVRPQFLEIIDKYFLPLGPKLLPCLIGLLICVLPGLEDDKSDTYGMVYEIVEKISTCVPERYFMRSLWLIFKRASKIRLPTLYVISNKLAPVLSPGSSQLSEERLDSLLPDRNELVLNSLIAASQDDSMITLRELMNFMSKYFLLDSEIFKYHSKAALCRNFLRLLRKRDWSLTRRIYQWLFNTNDLNESVETIDLTYFNNHSKSVIITAVKDLLKMRVNTLEEVIMPLKIVVTLISDIEVSVIADQLMPVLCIPILKYICDKIDDPDWQSSIIQESKIIFNPTLTSPYVVFNSIIEQFNKLFLDDSYNSIQEWTDILDLSNIYLDEMRTLTMLETVLGGLFMLLENALYKLLKLDIKAQVLVISHILRYISAILGRVESFINGEYYFETDLNYAQETKEMDHLIEVQKLCNDRIFKYLNHFYINSLTHFDNKNILTTAEVSVLDLLNNLAVRLVSIEHNLKTLPIINSLSENFEFTTDDSITNYFSDLTLTENANSLVNKYIDNNYLKKKQINHTDKGKSTNHKGKLSSDRKLNSTDRNSVDRNSVDRNISDRNISDRNISDRNIGGDISSEGFRLDGWIMCLLKCSLSSDPMIFCRGIRTFIQVINLPRKAHLKRFFSVSIFHLRNIIMQLWNSLVDRFSSFHSEIVLLLLQLMYSVPETSEEAEDLMVKDLTSRDVDLKIGAILRFGVLIKYLHIHAPDQLFFSEAIGFILDAVEESNPKLHYYARAFLSESIYMLPNLLDPILLFLIKFNPTHSIVSYTETKDIKQSNLKSGSTTNINSKYTQSNDINSRDIQSNNINSRDTQSNNNFKDTQLKNIPKSTGTRTICGSRFYRISSYTFDTETRNVMTEVVRRFRHLSSIIGREGQAILDIMQKRQVPIDLLKCVQGEDLFNTLSETLGNVPQSPRPRSELGTTKSQIIDKSITLDRSFNMENTFNMDKSISMEDSVSNYEGSFIKHFLKDTLRAKQFTINSQVTGESSARRESVQTDTSSLQPKNSTLLDDLISLNSPKKSPNDKADSFHTPISKMYNSHKHSIKINKKSSSIPQGKSQTNVHHIGNEVFYTPSSSILTNTQQDTLNNYVTPNDLVQNGTVTNGTVADGVVPSSVPDTTPKLHVNAVATPIQDSKVEPMIECSVFPRLFDPSYTCYSDESIYNYLDLVVVITLKYICLNVDLSSLILTSTTDDLLFYQQIISRTCSNNTSNISGNDNSSGGGVSSMSPGLCGKSNSLSYDVSMDDSTMLLRCTAIDFMKLFLSCLQPTNLSIEVSCLISKYLLLILYHFHLKDQHIIQTQMIYLLKVVMDRCHQEATTMSKPVSHLIALAKSLSKLPLLKTPTNQNLDTQTPKSQSSVDFTNNPDYYQYHSNLTNNLHTVNLHTGNTHTGNIHTGNTHGGNIHGVNMQIGSVSGSNMYGGNSTVNNMYAGSFGSWGNSMMEVNRMDEEHLNRYVSNDPFFENEYNRNLMQGMEVLPNFTKDFETAYTHLSPIYIINVANVRKTQLRRLTKLSEIDYFEKVLHICIGNAAKARCIHLLQSYIDFAIYNLKYLSGPETVKYASHFILELCTQLTTYKDFIGTTGMFYYIRALYFMFNHVTENYKIGANSYSARESKSTGKNLGLTDESGRPYFSMNKQKKKNLTDSAGFPHLDVTHLVQSCIQTLIWANHHNFIKMDTVKRDSPKVATANQNSTVNSIKHDDTVNLSSSQANSHRVDTVNPTVTVKNMVNQDKLVNREYEEMNDELNLAQKVSLENVTNQVIRLFKLLYLKLPYHFIKACIQLWDESNLVIPDFNLSELCTSMGITEYYNRNETKNCILLVLSHIPQLNSRLLLSYTLDMLESFFRSSEFKNASGYLILNTNVRESSLSEFIYAITTSKMIPQADVDSTFAELQRWVGLVLHYPKQPTVFLWIFQTLLKYEKTTVYNYSKVLVNNCKRLFNDLIMVVIYQACGLYSQKICHWLPQTSYDTLLPVPLQVQLINANYYFSNRILHSVVSFNSKSPITRVHRANIDASGLNTLDNITLNSNNAESNSNESIHIIDSSIENLIETSSNNTIHTDNSSNSIDNHTNTVDNNTSNNTIDNNHTVLNTVDNNHTVDNTVDNTIDNNNTIDNPVDTRENMGRYVMDMKNLLCNNTNSLLTSRAPSVSENDPPTPLVPDNTEVVCENALAFLIFFSYEILHLNRRTPITNIVFQSLHKSLGSHILPLMLERQTLQQRYFTLVLLRYLPYSLYEVPLSTIKKSMLEYINSQEFFRIDRNCLNVLVEIFRQVVEEDCKGSTDMMTRLDFYTNPPHMNVFSNKSSSLISRLKYLKRLAFVLYAAEHDTFSSNISNIIERLAETTRTFKNDTLRAKCLFVMRVLLAKTSQDNLTVLWPVLLSELIKIFRNTTEQYQCGDTDIDDIAISDINSDLDIDQIVHHKSDPLNKTSQLHPNTINDVNRINDVNTVNENNTTNGVNTISESNTTNQSNSDVNRINVNSRVGGRVGKLTERSRITESGRTSGRVGGSGRSLGKLSDRSRMSERIENLECPAHNKNALLIEAVKIVDIACSLRLNEFLVYQWMFIDDLTSQTLKDECLVNDFKPFLMMVEQMCPEKVRAQLKNLIWRSNEQYKFFGGKPVKSHNWEDKNTRELLNKSIENELIEDESQLTPIKPINLHQIYKTLKRFQ